MDLSPITARMPSHGRIGIGPGWHGLLLALDKELAALAPGYVIWQVKQDGGGMDVVAKLTEDLDEGSLAAFRTAILRARADSLHACEECGAPARTVLDGAWCTTLCREHAAEARAATQLVALPRQIVNG
ncbi:hypothetical protein NQ166_08820 [Microbacterium sp. zg.Y1090]|uniref:hypothetical protein n=1 Tax=Microbacterium wangruii TaxID=3049073 RepID=UPI00214D36C3|nr:MULTISPECIES: hypothetical protein [unclassified Microbacterium]MCR2818928.1 hypothetical protein [Microbacterium sp. zg.Y1090]WIM27235.1 hypothetical protein QNO26_08630 [Microbacterium sp. zg-Y1090]